MLQEFDFVGVGGVKELCLCVEGSRQERVDIQQIQGRAECVGA